MLLISVTRSYPSLRRGQDGLSYGVVIVKITCIIQSILSALNIGTDSLDVQYLFVIVSSYVVTVSHQ